MHLVRLQSLARQLRVRLDGASVLQRSAAPQASAVAGSVFVWLAFGCASHQHAVVPRGARPLRSLRSVLTASLGPPAATYCAAKKPASCPCLPTGASVLARWGTRAPRRHRLRRPSRLRSLARAALARHPPEGGRVRLRLVAPAARGVQRLTPAHPLHPLPSFVAFRAAHLLRVAAGMGRAAKQRQRQPRNEGCMIHRREHRARRRVA
jgi:hypothetical protein